MVYVDPIKDLIPLYAQIKSEISGYDMVSNQLPLSRTIEPLVEPPRVTKGILTDVAAYREVLESLMEGVIDPHLAIRPHPLESPLLGRIALLRAPPCTGIRSSLGTQCPSLEPLEGCSPFGVSLLAVESQCSLASGGV